MKQLHRLGLILALAGIFAAGCASTGVNPLCAAGGAAAGAYAGHELSDGKTPATVGGAAGGGLLGAAACR